MAGKPKTGVAFTDEAISGWNAAIEEPTSISWRLDDVSPIEGSDGLRRVMIASSAGKESCCFEIALRGTSQVSGV